MLLLPQERAEEASSIRTVIVSVTPVDARVSWSLCSEVVSVMFEWIKAKEFYSLVLRLRLVNWHWIERKGKNGLRLRNKHFFGPTSHENICFNIVLDILSGHLTDLPGSGVKTLNFRCALCDFAATLAREVNPLSPFRLFGQTLVKLWSNFGSLLCSLTKPNGLRSNFGQTLGLFFVV